MTDLVKADPSQYKDPVFMERETYEAMLQALRDTTFIVECLWHLQNSKDAMRVAEPARNLINALEGNPTVVCLH